MSKKFKLSLCYPCYSGYKCDRAGRRLPRKKKKWFKRLMEFPYIDFGFWYYPSSCDIAHHYKEMAKWHNWIDFLYHHLPQIEKLKEYLNDDCLEWSVNIESGKPELMWHWDDYNGLYTYSGKMKAIYLESEKDDTWAYDETIRTIKRFGLEDKNITSFVDLIKNIDPNYDLWGEDEY